MLSTVPRLLEAALAAKLTDPFVHILELGDYSVLYRVAGFLGDVKQLLTTRSKLRAKMLLTLHEAEVEIVSPTFMNQRQMDHAIRVLPNKPLAPDPTSDEESDIKAESLIFDKADAVAQFGRTASTTRIAPRGNHWVGSASKSQRRNHRPVD